jgi:hypothetical protein
MGTDSVIRRRVASGDQTAFFGRFDEGLETAVVVVYEAVDGLGGSRGSRENEGREDGEKGQKSSRR